MKETQEKDGSSSSMQYPSGGHSQLMAGMNFTQETALVTVDLAFEDSKFGLVSFLAEGSVLGG